MRSAYSLSHLSPPLATLENDFSDVLRPMRPADAGLTARPLFAPRGRHVLRERSVVRGGVTLTNFAMEKRIAPR